MVKNEVIQKVSNELQPNLLPVYIYCMVIQLMRSKKFKNNLKFIIDKNYFK